MQQFQLEPTPQLEPTSLQVQLKNYRDGRDRTHRPKLGKACYSEPQIVEPDRAAQKACPQSARKPLTMLGQSSKFGHQPWETINGSNLAERLPTIRELFGSVNTSVYRY